jgi:hypothetical protein
VRVRFDELHVVGEPARFGIDGDDRIRIQVFARTRVRLEIRSRVAGWHQEDAGLRIEGERRPECAAGDRNAGRVAPTVARRPAVGHDVEAPDRVTVLLIERPDVTGDAEVVAAGIADEHHSVPCHRRHRHRHAGQDGTQLNVPRGRSGGGVERNDVSGAGAAEDASVVVGDATIHLQR